jgi:radical SAM protein with 4Fe4S-binding SPASM domain
VSAHPLDRARRVPRTCIWEITGACNLRCVHCENHCGSRSPRELTLEQMEAVARSLAKMGCRTVDVTGGEPLLRRYWNKLCKLVTSLGMKTALITNGTLLDDEALDRAMEAGVGLIAVSIDGLKEVHDRTRLRPRPGPSPWEEAMEGLGRSLRRIETVVITQVNRHNLPQLPAMRDLLRSLGVKRWQLQLAVPTGRLLELKEPYVISPRDLEELTAFIESTNTGKGNGISIDTSDTIGYYTAREPHLRKRGGRQGVWVGCHEGKVRGCSAMPAEFDAGDLHDETLEEIWGDEERFAYGTRFDPRKLTGACATCAFGSLCRAGCTTMAYWVTGTIYENPYCLYKVRELERCRT